MTKKTQAEINKAIKSGMPAMVAGELKTRLEEADRFEAEINLQLDLINKQTAIIKELKTQITRESNLEDGEARVKKDNELLLNRAIRLDMREEILDLKEAHAAEKVTLMRDNFDTVFRNTTVRTKALEQKANTYSCPDGSGGTVTNTIHVPYDVVSETEEG